MKFDPKRNYEQTKQKTGFIPRNEATLATYQQLGFKSGLEVHQQLATKEKLFCRCPVGFYQKFDNYDAELVRHMRPTLSEMGTYDGTALMEFKTKKNIYYRIKNKTTCTYEVDDTPPFPINREALDYSIEIALLLQLNIVGEIHITRKQYLDGSIPTGFQRTAIIGIEGSIPLKNKNVRIIQLSIEEDSCREVSDIGHNRVYTTDRLGTPLIETVTYPDMLTPDEVKEAAQYIRFLNRSSNRVRKGLGAGREDVNVSISGGTRIEIKGVSHNKWIPQLTHIEAFRQKALLIIAKELNSRVKKPQSWKTVAKEIDFDVSEIAFPPIKKAMDNKFKLVAVNLPNFKGILSHFTQPGKTFANELSDRLKVIGCLEKPNFIHSEDKEPVFDENMLKKRSKLLGVGENDAQLVFWALEDDIKTAVETIDERCRMAFSGVPNETRKALKDGTTLFERVLPGADRMYPDTDSAPIPIKNEHIEKLRKNLKTDLSKNIKKLDKWNVAKDCYTYILRNNLTQLIEKIVKDLHMDPIFVTSLFGHQLKYLEGHYTPAQIFKYEYIYNLIKFVNNEKLEREIIFSMLPIFYQNPQMEMKSILNTINYNKVSIEEINSKMEMMKGLFSKIRYKRNNSETAEIDWIMGNLHHLAIGNVNLTKLRKEVEKMLEQRK